MTRIRKRIEQSQPYGTNDGRANGAGRAKGTTVANAAGIPVILVGIGVEEGEGKYISQIDFDFKDMGRAAGAWVAENVDEGEVAII